jgi:methylmalonyl-CoA/ethylmalonyl-CoA epimerase
LDSHIIGIHHLGIAVRNIKDESSVYIDLMGFTKETEILHEPPQKVDVQFFKLNDFRIELIQPVSADSPIISFLDKGGVLNHICYESSDIESTVKQLKKDRGFFQTVNITKASTLDDCYYSFFAKPTGEVVEIIYFEK